MSRFNGGIWSFLGAFIPVAIGVAIGLNTVNVSIARLEEQVKVLHVGVKEIKVEIRELRSRFTSYRIR